MLAELLESFSNAEDMFPYENTPGNTVTQEYGNASCEFYHFLAIKGLFT